MARPRKDPIDGAKLQDARKRRGDLTQGEVAKCAKCSERNVRGAETQNKCTRKLLEAICQAINLLNKGRSNREPEIAPEDFLIEQDHPRGGTQVEHPEIDESEVETSAAAEPEVLAIDHASPSVGEASPPGQSRDDSNRSTRSSFSGLKEVKQMPTESTYELTAMMIEELLANAESVNVLDFLQRHCPMAITEAKQGWVVAPEFRRGKGNVCEVLKRIREQIRGFNGASSSDWICLLNIVGGFLTFAIDPVWVEEQRSSARNGNVQYPSKRRDIMFTDRKAADLMHLLTAAIAHGFPRLNRVYDRESLENHELVVGPPNVGKEVVASRRRDELQLFIIKAIQPPNAVGENLNEIQLKSLFEATRSLIKIAAVMDRDPYFTWHEGYLAVAETLRSPEFNLRELLLISSANEKEPMNLVSKPSEAVLLFYYAYLIYQEIKKHLPPE